MRIQFIIRSLHVGGAERQLVTLATRLVRRGCTVSVVTFYGGGALEAELVRHGIAVRVLGKKGRWDVAGFLRSLVGEVRAFAPDILHSYLDVPNVICALARPMFPPLRLVWGSRASYMDFSRYDMLSRAVNAAQGFSARFADLVIANSEAGRRTLLDFGISRTRVVVVPNGIDTAVFAPEAEGRRRVRAEWKVPDDAMLVGLVARFDPMKDHPAFIEAASIVARSNLRVEFVCVGGGDPAYASHLRELAASAGLAGKLRWAGPRRDMPAVYNSLDLLVSSSSYGEGFPNVVAEAMSCGTPAVVTNVGDSASIVGDESLVAPPRDPSGLAARISAALPLLSELRGAARERIENRFSVEALVERSDLLFHELLQDGSH